MTSTPRIVYYAFGGGMGHVTRASAILRQLRRRGFSDQCVLTNTPSPLPLVHERIPYRHFTDHTPAALQTAVPLALQQLEPDLLIVDVFPHGIVNELADILPRLECRKVLVYRHLQAEYHAQLASALPQFDTLLLAEEPPAPFPYPAISCTPILLRDAMELLPREQVKAHLRAAEDEIVVLGVSSEPAWTDDFFPLLRKVWARLRPAAHLRLAAPGIATADSVHHYPLFELFNGIDIVVGAGGYNLFHEVQASGTRGIFLPQPRRFDDQVWRTRNTAVAHTPEELEMLLQTAITACHIPRENACFINGAGIAAESIATTLGARPSWPSP